MGTFIFQIFPTLPRHRDLCCDRQAKFTDDFFLFRFSYLPLSPSRHEGGHFTTVFPYFGYVTSQLKFPFHNFASLWKTYEQVLQHGAPVGGAPGGCNYKTHCSGFKLDFLLSSIHKFMWNETITNH